MGHRIDRFNGLDTRNLTAVLPSAIRSGRLYAMIYCGVRKAVEGFHLAQEVLREMGLE